MLRGRSARTAYTHPIDIKVAVHGKRQANPFDLDGKRVEIMEPDTANGNPVQSCTAPPPR